MDPLTAVYGPPMPWGLWIANHLPAFALACQLPLDLLWWNKDAGW